MNRKIILLTQFILSFGGGMSNIALLTLITKWFVSANYVGIYSFCLFVPRVLLATYIGNQVDQTKNLKRLLLLSMGWTAFFMLIVTGSVILEFFWWLVIWSLGYEIASSYYLPILTRLLVELFARAELSKLNASLSTAVTSANLFSGLIVTLAMGVVNLGIFLALDLGLYLLGLTLFLALKVELKVLNESQSVESFGSLWNGVKVVKQLLRKNRYLAPVFYLALLFNIVLAPQSVYFAELAHNVFYDLKLLGLFNTLFVSVFLLGSLFYRVVDVRLKIHEYISAASVLVPVAFSLIGSTVKWLVYGGIVLLGFAIPLYNISTRIILQTKIKKDQVATVSNSYYALLNAPQPVGLLGFPYLISLCGLSSILLGSAVLLALVTMVVLLSKQISSDLDLE
ncbi:MFS transporter [Ligilactobacillus apodemi]|uniref:MFS transporter n=1 Tax=Ligilactobacillus apodemi TaxID=307126 RepID=UPI00214AC8FE|nr:MFS transporter [Ligilactobacillus apodemi]MCR1901119.1 hypothetical protein [Ligilactobacillus apodemi]